MIGLASCSHGFTVHAEEARKRVEQVGRWIRANGGRKEKTCVVAWDGPTEWSTNHRAAGPAAAN